MNATGQAADGEAARLDVRDAACRRGGRLLFSTLSFTLASGEAALVSGPNGIGKSSLLRMLCGLLPTFAGTIESNGAMALADDRLALDSDQPLGRALGFWAAIDGRSERLLDVLDSLALAPLAEVPVRMLSTGQRKRAVLARVLASGAPIWLLDEPANGLDTASIALLGRAVEEHLWAGGIVVAASHQPLPWESNTSFTLARPNASEELWPEETEA
ncbi:MAG TPA: heme ABC exporter ATP-binding protein CcmA [Sphingobium sp.]|uniref:heme ABC exporter ATP-binding protein CcmA n=1 Tax=Sphingobium sp. TaxID=1912891 RepID=UPI002ECFEBA0